MSPGKKKKLPVEAAPAEDPAAGVKPDPEPEVEEKTPPISKAEGLAIAGALESTTVVLSFIRPGAIEAAIEGIRADASRYESLGCMFDPVGMRSKIKFYRQGLAKLEALLKFRQAIDLLEESKRDGAADREGFAKIAGLLG
jgi:hypothetical protein